MVIELPCFQGLFISVQLFSDHSPDATLPQTKRTFKTFMPAPGIAGFLTLYCLDML